MNGKKQIQNLKNKMENLATCLNPKQTKAKDLSIHPSIRQPIHPAMTKVSKYSIPVCYAKSNFDQVCGPTSGASLVYTIHWRGCGVYTFLARKPSLQTPVWPTSTGSTLQTSNNLAPVKNQFLRAWSWCFAERIHEPVPSKALSLTSI